MKINEVITNTQFNLTESIFDEPVEFTQTQEDVQNAQSMPDVYLDMDGVLADFFGEWAKLAGVKTGNYKDIPPAKIDPTLDKMIGTDFFDRLPKFSSTDSLVNIVKNMFGNFKILSSPLRGDHENSKVQKTKWIKRELKQQPQTIIIASNKDGYAVQADGTPNILIDDRGKNIDGWRSRGGFGIKYQADEDSLEKVIKGLEEYKAKYIDIKESNSKDNYGIPDGATLAQLDKIAKTATNPEKRERAHWLRNMRRGRNKKQ